MGCFIMSTLQEEVLCKATLKSGLFIVCIRYFQSWVALEMEKNANKKVGGIPYTAAQITPTPLFFIFIFFLFYTYTRLDKDCPAGFGKKFS